MYFFMIVNLDGIELNKISTYLPSQYSLGRQLPLTKWWDIWYFFHIKVLCLSKVLSITKNIYIYIQKKLFRYLSSLHRRYSRPPSYVWVSDDKTKNNKKVILSTTYLFTVYNYELTVRRILLFDLWFFFYTTVLYLDKMILLYNCNFV